MFFVLNILADCDSECGRVVNPSFSGSGGPGFQPRPSRCFLRKFIRFCLSSPRCINGYQRYTARGNPAMD